jgi:hypothetical protein
VRLRIEKEKRPFSFYHHPPPILFPIGRAQLSPPNMSAQPQANEAEKNIEIWKVKKLIKRLEQARGNGTSMISLIIRE